MCTRLCNLGSLHRFREIFGIRFGISYFGDEEENWRTEADKLGTFFVPTLTMDHSLTPRNRTREGMMLKMVLYNMEFPGKPPCLHSGQSWGRIVRRTFTLIFRVKKEGDQEHCSTRTSATFRSSSSSLKKTPSH